MEPTVDHDRTVQLLHRLVEIESVNPTLDAGGRGEGAIARHLADRLEGAGLEVRLVGADDARPSVLARLAGSGGGPSLMLNGHLDTVPLADPDQLRPRLEGDRLYGRGAYDMKGGVAAAVAVLEALGRAGKRLEGDLWLAAVADEEYASAGTEGVLGEVVPDAAIVTEPTGGRVCIAHKGFTWIELITTGRAAHGSRPDLGVDANRRMARLMNRIEALFAEAPGVAHPVLGGSSFHFGELHGGAGWSTYAQRCSLRLELRTLPGESHPVATGLDTVLAELEDADFPVASEVVLDRPPFETRPDGRLARVLLQEAGPSAGEPFGVGYWTDAALLAGAGADTVVFGPDGEGAHANSEWVSVRSVLEVAQTLLRTAIRYCGFPTQTLEN